MHVLKNGVLNVEDKPQANTLTEVAKRLIKWDTDFPVNGNNGYVGLKELDRIIADAKAALAAVGDTHVDEFGEQAPKPVTQPCGYVVGEVTFIATGSPLLTDRIKRVSVAVYSAPPPTPVSHVVVTAEAYNAAFDPANDALGGAFMAGFREGWIYAETDADGERYQEMAEEYAMAVDTAPGEAWDAHRATFFAMLPLASIPEVGAPIGDLESPTRKALIEALTPSGDTKSAFIGEFHFEIQDADEDGEECRRRVVVPWTTVKEIMTAISAYALAATSEGSE